MMHRITILGRYAYLMSSCSLINLNLLITYNQTNLIIVGAYRFTWETRLLMRQQQHRLYRPLTRPGG